MVEGADTAKVFNVIKERHWLSGSIAALVAISSLFSAGCAVNPAPKQKEFVPISEAEELKLGRQWHTQVMKQYKAYDDGALQGYVQRIGEQLAAKSLHNNLVHRFTVIDSDDVNAFSLPGGYIYIPRGLLAYLNSEAELAAVLAHELGHVAARHSAQQISAEHGANFAALMDATKAELIQSPDLRNQARQNLTGLLGNAVTSGYGFDNELEANRIGVEYLVASGYEPQAMIDVIRVLKHQQEFEMRWAKEESREPRSYHGVFATPPDKDPRLKKVVSKSREVSPSATTRLNREDFLMILDGLAFGDSEQQGLRRGNRFYHKGLGFSLTFPENFSIENTSELMLAFPKNQEIILQVTMEELPPRMSPLEYLTKSLKLVLLSKGAKLNIAGLDGYTALAKSRTPFGIRDTRFGVVYHNDKVFIIAGASKEEKSLPSFDKLFLKAINSFHVLSEEEQKSAQGLKIRVIRIDKEQRFAELAARSSLSDYAEEQLRLLNHKYPSGEPTLGQRLKIVE